jgi:hypothetical protein
MHCMLYVGRIVYHLCLRFFFGVPVPSKESEWSRIGELEVSILSLSTIVLLYLATVTAVWYFCSFVLFL